MKAPQCDSVLALGGFNLKLGRIWDDKVELTIHLPQVNLE